MIALANECFFVPFPSALRGLASAMLSGRLALRQWITTKLVKERRTAQCCYGSIRRSSRKNYHPEFPSKIP